MRYILRNREAVGFMLGYDTDMMTVEYSSLPVTGWLLGCGISGWWNNIHLDNPLFLSHPTVGVVLLGPYGVPGRLSSSSEELPVIQLILRV